jgi:hypothetical protein
MVALVIHGLTEEGARAIIDYLVLTELTPVEIGEAWNAIHTSKTEKPLWTKAVPVSDVDLKDIEA